MIRHAVEQDLPRIVEMGRRFLRESPYHDHFLENPTAMEQLVRRLMLGPGGFLVAFKEGKLVGMLGYVIHDHFISGERVAGEVVWWIEPEARGGRLAIQLIYQAEREARAAGAVSIQMIAPNLRVTEMYARMGYEKVETTCQKRL